MANFYTYGRMPSAEDTVYGLAGLDQEPVYVPREESVPVAPLNEAPPPDFSGVDPGLIPQEQPRDPIEKTVGPGTPPGMKVNPNYGQSGQPYYIFEDEPPSYTPREENVPIAPLSQGTSAPAPARYDEKGNLLPSADSPLAQMSGGVPQWVKMRELFGGTPSLIPNLVTAGSGGKDLTTGDLYRIKREQAVKDYEAKVQRFKDAGEFNPGIDESLKSLLNQQLESLAQEEVGYLNQLPQRQTLSNLLRENKFEEAYKFAQDNGMQMLLFRSDQLKNLREPFTKEEAKAFMRAMPYEFFKSAYGDQYEFEKAFKFDPEGAENRGALNWIAFDQSGRPMIQETKEGVKAVQSETGYPMLDKIFELQEVKKDTGIFEKLFKAAAIATAVVGGAQALGVLGGGAGAGAGALTGVTPTGLVPGTTAANLAAAKAAATGAGTLAGGAALPTFTVTAGGGLTGAQLAALGAAGAGAGGLGGGAGAAPTTTTPPPDNLQEILVQATKPKPVSLLGPGTLASTSLIQGTPDVPVDIYGRPTEPPQPSVEEIVVRGTKPPVSPIDLAAVGGLGALNQTLSQQVGYQKPGIETTPTSEQGLPEIVVQGTKPPVIDLLDVGVGGLTAQQLTQGFTQPQVDPLTGQPKQPPKTQQELDAIQEALKAGKAIPGTASALDQVKSVLDKANTARKVADLLKSLGLLGAGAAAGGRGTAAPVTGAGGFGGALPKFQLQRTPLQPQVDYYRYGLGPEARFFEDKLAEVPPSEYETTRGPDAGIVNPKDRPPVFAEGGLAKGGRYMEGPGSGRDDKIPALLSDGEYVIDAETLALLGDGSPKEGAKRMDQFRANIRRHKGDALSRGRISPDAKSPSKYMGGGLTR